MRPLSYLTILPWSETDELQQLLIVFKEYEPQIQNVWQRQLKNWTEADSVNTGLYFCSTHEGGREGRPNMQIYVIQNADTTGGLQLIIDS